MATTHLVGSVGLDDAEDVFRTAAKHLGDSLRRLPDGERGERDHWIGFQYDVLCSAEGIEAGPVVERTPGLLNPEVRMTRSVAEISLPELRYRQHAETSYALLRRLKDEGAVPEHVRFQVCLPTPVAVVNAFVPAEAKAAFEEVYERAMVRELERILAVVPAAELAIQWDVAHETALLEGYGAPWFRDGDGAGDGEGDVLGSVTERLARLGTAVPEAAELGYHLCYGNRDRKHFKEPADLSLLVRLANAVGATLPRRIDWFHMPVPHYRTDHAYFLPLRDLDRPEAHLYLGLVHQIDGVAGAQRRSDVAAQVLAGGRGFGVSTECGIGQVPADVVPRDWITETLDICQAVSTPEHRG
ncbi:MAG: hypothetical protein QOF85_2612 [Solirubrobacterales bacterium]|nr:hypothetical protein [Solirubrobacterales bacterium]